MEKIMYLCKMKYKNNYEVYEDGGAFTNRKHTKETKEKIAAARLGRKFPNGYKTNEIWK